MRPPQSGAWINGPAIRLNMRAKGSFGR